MRKRAEQVAETRQRIVDATVRLHGTLGPSGTTISAIAEEADVTRVTVYRHFPDEAELFAACSARWHSTQTPPDPDAWSVIDDPEQRLRDGLADLYRFFRGGESMLSGVFRDRPTLPKPIRARLDEDDRRHRDVLLEPFRLRGGAGRRTRALLGHAVSFWTWRSLCIDQGLSDAEAVEAMSALVLGTARD